MKIKISILIHLIVFICVNTSKASDFEFGEVSKEELQEKRHSIEKDADAAVLYKNVETSFFRYSRGLYVITRVHMRVKIYNNDGLYWANQEIKLYKGSRSRESVVKLEAYTYNLENGVVVVSKLEKDGVFTIEENKYYDNKKFTLPNVKKGSIIEYQYTLESPYFTRINHVQVQYTVPVNKIRVYFKAPQYYFYKAIYGGFIPLVPKKHSDSKIIEIEKENIPAFKFEGYLNSIRNYISIVDYELSHIQYPNSQPIYYSNNWEKVIKTMFESDSYRFEINKKNYFRNDLDEALADVEMPLEKVMVIYDFLKSKVKWNSYYGKYTDEGVKDAYDRNEGNVADINLMLISMFRYAGFESNPVLVSSRGNGIPLFPTLKGYDYVIAAVQVGNDTLLLDASCKYCNMNTLPERAMNWNGRLIYKNGESFLINLSQTKLSQKTSIVNISINENGSSSGTVQSRYFLNRALEKRKQISGNSENQIIESIENKLNSIEISDYSIKNGEYPNNPLDESFSFISDQWVEIIGNKIYISPLFFFTIDENLMKAETREYPVEFSYPFKTKVMVNIKLPDGYEVASKPENKIVQLPEGVGEYKFMISVVPGGLSVMVMRQIEKATLQAEYYSILKEYYTHIVDKEKERVVIKMVQ